ncbi:MAG: type II secretion system F family protein [Microthrixaceae bacterium]
MSRLTTPVALVALFSGTWLILGTFRPLRRVGLRRRLAPYSLAGSADPGTWSDPVGLAGSVQAVLVPLAEGLGERLAHLGGIQTDIRTRLRRAGSPLEPAEFRLTQFLRALLSLAAALMVMVWLQPPAGIWVMALIGVPLLVVLAGEQQLETAIEGRSARLEAELPVMSEQMAVLLASGMSLGATLERICARGHGAVAQDLREVQLSVRQGSSEIDALRAWADLARSPGVEHLVGVLCMHRDATDLGALLATEARSIRADAHRRTIESIERRAQLVWIPVTVATLVPGLILIGVPFVSAMSRITG